MQSPFLFLGNGKIVLEFNHCHVATTSFWELINYFYIWLQKFFCFLHYSFYLFISEQQSSSSIFISSSNSDETLKSRVRSGIRLGSFLCLGNANWSFSATETYYWYNNNISSTLTFVLYHLFNEPKWLLDKIVRLCQLVMSISLLDHQYQQPHGCTYYFYLKTLIIFTNNSFYKFED